MAPDIETKYTGHRKHCYQHYIDINSFTAAPASKIADAGSYIFKDCNNSRIRGKYHELHGTDNLNNNRSILNETKVRKLTWCDKGIIQN